MLSKNLRYDSQYFNFAFSNCISDYRQIIFIVAVEIRFSNTCFDWFSLVTVAESCDK